MLQGLTHPAAWTTIYADASYHPETGATGYGIWGRHDDDFVAAYGPCPAEAQSSAHAEAYAIARGLELAIFAWGEKSRGITIKSDCQGVVAWYEKQRVDESFIGQCVSWFAQLRGERVVRVKWVKGHQGNRSPQGAVNGKADQYADIGRTSQNHRIWIRSVGTLL